MIIEEDIKLDFKDVLIRPKRSTLSSRKEVSLERTYNFKWSGNTWTGVPLAAANMDGIGTFPMTKELQKHKILTCAVKSYTLEQWVVERDNLLADFTAISTGTGHKDFERLKFIVAALPKLQFICIDVANGYSEHFGDFVAKVRKEFPNKTIIAGIVVTADMTQELILRGADIV